MEPGASPLPRPKPRPPEPLPPRTPGGSLRNLEHENADGRFNMPPPSHPIYRRMILSSSLPESPRIDRGAIAKLQHQAARRQEPPPRFAYGRCGGSNQNGPLFAENEAVTGQLQQTMSRSSAALQMQIAVESAQIDETIATARRARVRPAARYRDTGVRNGGPLPRAARRSPREQSEREAMHATASHIVGTTKPEGLPPIRKVTLSAADPETKRRARAAAFAAFQNTQTPEVVRRTRAGRRRAAAEKTARRRAREEARDYSATTGRHALWNHPLTRDALPPGARPTARADAAMTRPPPPVRPLPLAVRTPATERKGKAPAAGMTTWDEQDAEERSPRAKNEKEAKIRDAMDLLSSRQRQEKIEEVDRRLARVAALAQ